MAPRAPKIVTVERIEAALDRLAEIMVDLGPQGAVCLPIYQRLEDELAVRRRADDAMAAVRARARRSKDQKAELPA